ncbi:hypothetical protein MMJ09_21570, partial [Bacillus vallismortis]|nr:hypothetical protein [Bacillus vallismortis]
SYKTSYSTQLLGPRGYREIGLSSAVSQQNNKQKLTVDINKNIKNAKNKYKKKIISKTIEA